MKAYSVDLRERVLQAVDKGYPRTEIIKLFGISRATIKRYLKQRRETGNVNVRPIPGRPSKKFAPLQAGLVAQLQEHPDATLEIHCQLWEQEHGLRVSTTTMGRAIRRMGWTRKKDAGCHRTQRRGTSRLARTTETARCPPARGNRRMWFEHRLDSPLCPCAQRVASLWQCSAQSRQNTTLIAALSFGGMGESMIIEGAANAAAFEQYVEEILVPSLTAGNIVIMDNLAAHKGKKVEQLIEGKGCQLLFLPASSPDFSPIEEPFSKLKTFLRRVGARTHEALQDAMCQALLTVTEQDAHGWFRHCGYLPGMEGM